MVDVKILKHKIKLCDRTKLKCTLCERLCKRMKNSYRMGEKYLHDTYLTKSYYLVCILKTVKMQQ